MPRYILIDNDSGYVFGDTADLPTSHVIDGDSMAAVGTAGITPELAARWLDETQVGEYGRTYERRGGAPSANSPGYHVYEASGTMGDGLAVIEDGQDPDTIEEVKARCTYVCFLSCEHGERW